MADDDELERPLEVERLLTELRADTTPEQRASVRRAMDDLYDEQGLPS